MVKSQKIGNDPCNDCLRWSECNGVDIDRCPLTQTEESKKNEVNHILLEEGRIAQDPV